MHRAALPANPVYHLLNLTIVLVKLLFVTNHAHNARSTDISVMGHAKTLKHSYTNLRSSEEGIIISTHRGDDVYAYWDKRRAFQCSSTVKVVKFNQVGLNSPLVKLLGL